MRIRVLSLNCSNRGQLVQFYIKVTYSTGYLNIVNGVAAASIGKVNGVATADISKVNGV